MHIYLPYADPPQANQSATDLTIAELAGPLTVSGYQLVPQPCIQLTDYEDGFRHWWHQGLPFLVWEHDIVPTYAMIAELAQCPEPWCAQAYLLTHDARPFAALRDLIPVFEASDTARSWSGYADWQAYIADIPPLTANAVAWQTVAHRVATAEGWRWLRPGEDWADYVGFGLTKFTPDVPLDRTDWRAGSWRDLDSRVSDWAHARGIRWHIHWPLAAHYHVLEG